EGLSFELRGEGTGACLHSSNPPTTNLQTMPFLRAFVSSWFKSIFLTSQPRLDHRPHHVHRRRLARPRLELGGGLSDEHFDAVDRLRAGRLGLLQQLGL